MAGIISKRVLEDIRFRSDIADIIGSYLTLKRAGSSFKGLCPFHKEKTPSFHVNPQRQIFHCFGCGAGGDVFGFVMQYENVDFVTAARILADRAGITLEIDEGPDRDYDKALLYRIHGELAEFYRRCLLKMKSAASARTYLKERSIDHDAAERFAVGYAPDRWDSVLQWGAKKGYDIKQLEQAGLVLPNSRPAGNRTHYDRFRNRIMFPISDEQGRIIGFSGRSIDPDDKGAKYINSPETPLFIKGRILYALDKARRSIADSREALICEGQIDVIRCHLSGFNTAVAAQGTAFTEDHARAIKRYADSVCIVFDSDSAGRNAAIRAASVFIAAGLAVRIAALPPGEDPDSFIRKNGAGKFGETVNKACSAVEYHVRTLSEGEQERDEAGTMRIAGAVLGMIANSPNAVQRARLIQESAALLDLPVDALRDDLNYMLKRARHRAPESRDRSAPAAQSGSGHQPPVEEVCLCECLVNMTDNAGLAGLVREYLPPEMVADPLCRTVVETALEAAERNCPFEEILRDGDNRSGELHKFAAGLMMAPVRATGENASPEDAVKDIILRCWQKRLRRQRRELDGPSQRRATLTYRIKALSRWDTGADIIHIELNAAK